MNQFLFFDRIVWSLRKKAYMRSKALTFSEKRALTESFIAMVSKHLPEGFWKYDRSQFSSVEGGVERMFVCNITDKKLELWVQVGVGIRLIEVEKIWQQSQGIEKSLGQWTVPGDISSFVRNAKDFYSIDHIKDIGFFEPQIRELIEKACLPFWKRFATVADVDRDWNTRAFDFDRDATDALHHATRSVIIARLVKNPDFERLAVMRREEVASRLHVSLRAQGLEQYDRLVDWLRK
jgi:hypothetical protein